MAAEQTLQNNNRQVQMEKPKLPPKSNLPPKPAQKQPNKEPGESIMNLVNEETVQKTATYETYKDKSVEELEAILDGYRKGDNPPATQPAVK